MTIPPPERSSDRFKECSLEDVNAAGDGDVPARPPLAGPLAVLGMSAWFGAWTGLVEVAVLLAWHRLDSATVLGSLQMNRHFLWMIPVSHLAVFLACGLPMAIAARVRPGPALRGAVFVFVALSAFALLKIVPGLYTAAAAVLASGVAFWAGKRLVAGSARLRRPIWPTLSAGLGLVAALGVFSYDRVELAERRALAGLPPAPAGVPNVLLIVLDTVRADRLSLYGYGRDTTPNLARLARRGVVFEQARSAAPWTLPSHASLFTGRWPHELRVGGDRPLDATYPTLAQSLAGHGYATAGFVGNTYFCNSWYGLGRGFAHYEDYYEQNIIVSPDEAFRCTALGRWLIRTVGTAYNARPETVNTPKDAERVNHDFLRWLSANRGRPFFAFLNYIDAHDPYITPPGFDRHFGLKPESAADVEIIRNWHHRHATTSSERNLTLVSDAYDDCLASLDENLGRLFDDLERRGILRDTLVIVTADHGEQLGDHGLQGHGKSLYRGEVHVPLVLVGPAGIGIPEGRSIAGPASLRDVAATVMERLGLAASSPFPGRTLAHFWEPGSQAGAVGRDEPILSEVSIKEKPSKHPAKNLPPASLGPMTSLLSEGKVYIRDAYGREELYDVAADPDESRNLAGSPEARPSLLRHRLTLDGLVNGSNQGPAMTRRDFPRRRVLNP
jgi:arylsulfatase A-like enzyme